MYHDLKAWAKDAIVVDLSYSERISEKYHKKYLSGYVENL
jgi:hypothetical protein